MSYLLLAGGANAVGVRKPLVRPQIVVHPKISPLGEVRAIEDTSGPRRMIGCSYFTAGRDALDNPSRLYQQLDAIPPEVLWVRCFRYLCKGFEPEQPGDYYYGRAVMAKDAIKAQRILLRALKDRGLKCGSTAAGIWPNDDLLIDFQRDLFRDAQQEGLADVFLYIEGNNEYWQPVNSGHGAHPPVFKLYRRLREVVHQELNPTPWFCIGAPSEEGTFQMLQAVFGSTDDVAVDFHTLPRLGDFLEIHGKRDPDLTVKRTFGRKYFEGHPEAFPYWQLEGEPAGPQLPPPHADMFMAINDPGRLTAVGAMNLCLGFGWTHFTAASVKGWALLDAEPSLQVLPKLLSHAPEDIAQWGTEPGGRIIWWRDPKSQRTCTVFDQYWLEKDGVDVAKPPRPLKRWELVGPDWTVRSGTGTFNPNDPKHLPANFGGALLLGEYA